jgi:hypothetical protein
MGVRMLHPLFRTLVKVIFASLILGTVMTISESPLIR